jgi:IS30 family transposase
LLGLMAHHPGRMRTITADNGTEFHWYGQVEAVSPVKFYFATPHHSWERGTNENTNGLIRQYLPKGATMARVTRSECDLIAEHLNNRPRKRHGYKTPNQCFLQT